MKENIKYPIFSEYDFIRLYCALIVKNGKSPLLFHHDIEKQLYNFYSISEFKILFEDICAKKDYIKNENSYLILTRAFQTAQTFGLLVEIQGVGENKSLILCNKKEAEEIILSYSNEIVDKMSCLVQSMENYFENLKQNKEMIETVKSNGLVNIFQEKGMVKKYIKQ